MTKAARIRALYAEGKSIKEIAAIVGCLDAYVRVCAQQRRNGPSKADITHRPEKMARAAWRYRNDPEFRERRKAQNRACRSRKRKDPAARERYNAYMREWMRRKREAIRGDNKSA